MTQTQQQDIETLHHLLEEILSIKDTIKQQMVTKDDLKKSLAKHITKDDAKNFATKEDIAILSNKIDATKEELNRELKIQLSKQTEDICKINTDLFNSTDKIKADKTEVAALDQRVTKLEHN